MDDFRSKHAAHRVEVDELPYGPRTFLWPLSELRPLAEPVWFHNHSKHRCGDSLECRGSQQQPSSRPALQKAKEMILFTFDSFHVLRT